MGQLWYHQAELTHGYERLVPFAASQLLFNLARDWLSCGRGARERTFGGAVLAGARSKPLVICTTQQRRIAGVSFRDGGVRSFLRMPAREVAEDHVNLEDVWGIDGRVVRERLLEAPDPAAVLDALEQVLLEQLVGSPVAPRDMQLAMGALGAGHSVNEVSERLGCTGRRLIDRFADRVGLSPKRYARVTRLTQVVEGLTLHAQPTWAHVAAMHGYYDQAHLIREFRLLVGITPTEYVPRSERELTHVPLQDPDSRT